MTADASMGEDPRIKPVVPTWIPTEVPRHVGVRMAGQVTVRTASGSCYVIDFESMYLRRIRGTVPSDDPGVAPTAVLRRDGDALKILRVITLAVGRRAEFDVQPLGDPNVVAFTRRTTTLVVAIEPATEMPDDLHSVGYDIIGPFLTAAAVARELGRETTDMERMVAAGELIGIHAIDKTLVIPAPQFDGKIGLTPGVPELVHILRTECDEWTIALWALSWREQWQGFHAVDVLRRGWSYPVLFQAWRSVMHITDGGTAVEEPAAPDGWDWKSFDPPRYC